MKNILLTSGGLTEPMKTLFFEKIDKTPEETKILFLPAAASYRDDARESISVTIYHLRNMGIPVKQIWPYNLDYILSKDYQRTYSQHVTDIPPAYRLLTVEEMLKYDAIFVCGGYSEFLLRQMNRTGFDAIVKESVEQGLFYIGMSAGSMVAAGNFDTGLRIIENALQVHQNVGTPSGDIVHDEPILLSDTQAVYVSDEKKVILE